LAKAVGKGSPALGKVAGKTGTYTDRDLLNGRSYLRAKVAGGSDDDGEGEGTGVLHLRQRRAPSRAASRPVREGKVIGTLCEIIQQHGR